MSVLIGVGTFQGWIWMTLSLLVNLGISQKCPDLEGWPHFKGEVVCIRMYIQWTPSNPTHWSKLGVTSNQGWICTTIQWSPSLGTWQSGLNTGVASFQGSRLEGVHCIQWNPSLQSLLGPLNLISDVQIRESLSSEP